MSRARKHAQVRSDQRLAARGWIEPAVGKFKDGMFDADRDYLGPNSSLTFFPAGAKWTEALVYVSRDVESVRLMPRGDLPQEAIDAHSVVFANKGLTDSQVILGWLAGPTGVPRSDLFVLVPITVLGTSDQWMELFRKIGAV